MSATIALPRAEPAVRRPFFELDLLDNRYPALHGLRVLGIVSIVQYHVTMVLRNSRELPIDDTWSATSFDVFFGMDLFFVLSGFLIGSILLHSVASSGTANLRRFYLRRAFRTFPPYYVVLTILAAIGPLTSAQHRHLWFEYVYLTNYGGHPLRPGDLVMPWGWSLALEEQFYLAVPFLLLLLYRFRSDRARLTLLGGLWISALVIRLALYIPHPYWNEFEQYDHLYYKTHARFDTLIAGVALAYVQRRWGAPIARWLERPFSRALLAFVGLICLWLLMQPYLLGPWGVGIMHVISWGTLTSIMYFAWTLLLLNGGPGWAQRALSLPLFRKVATLGYGVYLVHLPLYDRILSHAATSLFRDRGWPMVVVWPSSVVALLLLSLGVSYGIHLAVEKPFLRIRDRLASAT
jgi:peptidoglycan/LPS O-acetylase OafA/YrhL